MEKWSVRLFPAIKIPYLGYELLSMHECGSIVQDLLVQHKYLDSEQKTLQQNNPDEDGIMEVIVENEEI